MKIRAVIIDDEKNTINVIRVQLERHFSSVELVGSTTDSEEAFSLITKTKPHLVFLDIEMPNLSGFDVLRQFEKRDFEVVFVTAYDQYAVDAFKQNAIGYILKPVDKDDFIKTVTTGLIRISEHQLINTDQFLSNIEKKKNEHTVFTVIDDDKKVVLTQNEVIYCHADGSYCEIRTTSKKYLMSKNLKRIISTMPDWNFIKISRSCIINPNHIIGFTKKNGVEITMSDKSIVKVSSRIKTQVFSTLKTDYNIF